LRLAELGVLAGDYDAAAHRLSLRWICGPSLGSKKTASRKTASKKKDSCGYGDTVWSTSFTASAGR
jgi:hypothetical protein